MWCSTAQTHNHHLKKTFDTAPPSCPTSSAHPVKHRCAADLADPAPCLPRSQGCQGESQTTLSLACVSANKSHPESPTERLYKGAVALIYVQKAPAKSDYLKMQTGVHCDNTSLFTGWLSTGSVFAFGATAEETHVNTGFYCRALLLSRNRAWKAQVLSFVILITPEDLRWD